MKNTFRFVSACLLTMYLSSCATVFGGRVSECQRTPTAKGQTKKEVRGAALILDVLLFPPGIFVDFVTGAIYKPCEKLPTK